jgi:DNA-binding protein HU-beta
MLKVTNIDKEEEIVNKTELVASVAEKAAMTKKDAEKAINALFASIEEALAKKDKVQVIGFGTFEVKARGARKGRNPQTGKEITIPASKTPVFKAGKGLKDSVNKK